MELQIRLDPLKKEGKEQYSVLAFLNRHEFYKYRKLASHTLYDRPAFLKLTCCEIT